jgi:hypothetical protein
LITVRAWLASAGWACLCGIASMFFLTISLVGLFVLFFGALISAMLAPFLLLLPADWQWTGGQWLAAGVALWLAVVVLFGALARWAYLRCRAVVFAADVASWARASSVIVGAVLAFVLVGTVPGLAHPLLPQGTPLPEPSRDDPVTV